MNYHLTLSALACLALAQAQNPDQPVINTPSSVVQCLPSLLTFNGGTPPYTITAIPAGQVGAAPVADLGTQAGTDYTWNVTLAAGTAITLQIRDSRGVINYSQAVTIQPNSDSSCLNSKGGNNNPSTPTTPSPSAPVSTGTSSANPSSNNPTSGATANSTSGAHPNSTAPATGKNSTTTTPSTTSPTVNQNKGPSVFTPPNTPNVSNSSPASNNAPNSAASGSSVHYKGLVAGLAIVGVALTIFA